MQWWLAEYKSDLMLWYVLEGTQEEGNNNVVGGDDGKDKQG